MWQLWGVGKESRGYNRAMKRVDRRAALGIWATGAVSAVAAACGERGSSVIQTPEGPVLQLAKDDFLVLVSGFQTAYHPGDRIGLKVIVNNQSSRFATARVRTRLLGRGQQALVEAEVATINIKPMDATALERSLLLPRDLTTGEYTLSVELPPWSFEGRQAGGGTLNATVKIERD